MRQLRKISPILHPSQFHGYPVAQMSRGVVFLISSTPVQWGPFTRSQGRVHPHWPPDTVDYCSMAQFLFRNVPSLYPHLWVSMFPLWELVNPLEAICANRKVQRRFFRTPFLLDPGHLFSWTQDIVVAFRKQDWAIALLSLKVMRMGKLPIRKEERPSLSGQ